MFKPLVYHVADAAYVKLHFSRLQLPEGVYVEISNPDGTETWRYSSNDRDPHTVEASRGDDGIESFWAMSISGDTAIVRLTGRLSRFDPMIHGFEIDTKFADFPEVSASANILRSKEPQTAIESTCGADEMYDAVCWADSYPDHFERSSPVALLITSTGKKCTAWRVGGGNRMFTARHCISKQSQLDGAEIWFNYQSTMCGSEDPAETVKVTGGDLLVEDYGLDFALFTLADKSSIVQFGNLGLDLRDGNVGEEIFIPQHGLGNPKQIAIESDMNSGGPCRIDDTSVDGYSMESDIGYMCDTTTSSSGSPVISGETGRVIALHHLGGCMNSGAKMTLIWPLVQDYFSSVPEGDASGKWKSANELPNAEISVTCDGMSCDFDGSDSSDSDGSIESYEWMIDEDMFSGATLSVEFDESGDHEITLAVTDDEGAIDIAAKTITLAAPNEDPTAKFSTSCIENDCSFNASGSSDPDGDIVEWNWSFGDGAKASGESVDHEYDAEGSYKVTLTVLDDGDASDDASYTVAVTLPNDKPEAMFSVSCSELTCSLDAGASTDSDGEIVEWNWDLGDGSTASGETVQHSYAEDGDYTVVLSVIDDEQASDQFNRDVTVTKAAPNEKPLAYFSRSCNELSCSFDAGSSGDPDGEIVDWAWKFGDGSTAAGESVQHTYSKEGSYTVVLTVTDDKQASDQFDRDVTVSKTPTNERPEAGFSRSCDDLSCSFDGSLSSDPDGEIVEWAWDLGDGSQASGRSIEHNYAKDGDYTVRLVVTDDQGLSDSYEREVSVETQAAAPVARFSVSCEDLSCSLDAGASTASEQPAPSYDWSFGDGTTGTGGAVTHEYAEDGLYTVTLKVTDENGSATTRRTVHVSHDTPPELTLAAAHKTSKAFPVIDLSWSGAESGLELYRNGQLITAVAASGSYSDKALKGHGPTVSYTICEIETGRCSNTIKLEIGKI
ncbi:MAG: PKD domain-containing protein [Lysobacterales bacterium]